VGEIPAGCRGAPCLGVSPQSFPVRVPAGTSLNQLRLLEGPTSMSDAGLASLYRETPLLYDDDDRVLPLERVACNDGLCMGIDLSGRATGGVIGYRAHPNPPAVDLARVGHYDPSEFWEPIKAPARDGYILEANRLYLLASKEPTRAGLWGRPGVLLPAPDAEPEQAVQALTPVGPAFVASCGAGSLG